MRRMLRVLLSAFDLLVGSCVVANAGPLGLAVAGFIGLTGTAATLVAGAINLVVGFGLSYLSQALLGRKPTTSTGGSSGKLQSGGAVPRSFMMARGMTAGSLVYANTWGHEDNTPNAYLSMVIAVSDLPSKGLAEIWVGGDKVTWNPAATPDDIGIPIPEYEDDGDDHLWVRFYDGTQTAADTLMVAKFAGSADRPYASTRVGTGITYVVMTARLSDKLWSGFPQYKFVLDGVPMYDLREDSSVGGDGDQVWGAPETYSLAPANSIVQAYNILRGIRYGSAWFFGGQTISGYQLPLSEWVAAANECDIAISLDAGGTEAQYRAGGEVSLDVEPLDLVVELLKTSNGRLAECGGIYKPHVGAAGTAVFSFTDDDILSTEKQTFDPFQSLDQVVNAVTGKYVEPAEGWNQKDAPPLYSASLEAEDAGRRQAVDVTYALVFSGTQAQRLMLSARNEARRFRQHALPLPTDCSILEPNDFVAWTSARNGYVAKLFRTDAVQDLANGNVGVNLTEVDAGDYTWIPGINEKPIVTGPTVIVRPPAQTIVDWSAIGVTINGDGGKARAGIRMAWDPGIDDVDGVQFEVRLAADASMVYQGETDRWDAGAIVISQNILGQTIYQVRGRYRPASPRATSWSGWLTLTTPDISEGLTAQNQYELDLVTNEAQGSMQELRNDLANALEGIANSVIETAGQGFEQRAQIKQTLKVVSGSLTAAVVKLTQAIIDGDTALAEDVTAIDVKADQMSAGGFVKFAAGVAPSGATARFQVFLNAGTLGSPDWKEAGLMLDIVGGIARFFVTVDKFVIGDATTGLVPFSVQDGKVIMQHVTLQSASSAIKLELDNDALIFTEPG